MFYSIGEVARMLSVSTESLRSWEKKGLFPKPSRRPTNHRIYTDADITAIKEWLNQKNLTR